VTYVEKETTLREIEMLHFVSSNYFHVRADGSVGLKANFTPSPKFKNSTR
jgi:hypothetical protein